MKKSQRMPDREMKSSNEQNRYPPYGECVNITNRVSLAIAAEPAPNHYPGTDSAALHANLVRLTVLVHTRTPLVAAAQAAQGAASYARLSDDSQPF